MKKRDPIREQQWKENFLLRSQESRADPGSSWVEPFALAGWVVGERRGELELESELGDRETIIMDDVNQVHSFITGCCLFVFMSLFARK